jgi:hypothetical protein
MSPDFEQLVDVDGLEPGLRDRLRRVHDQLVAAGPPPELTPALQDAPAGDSASLLPFPARRRPLLAALAFAAAIAAAAFGGGFLLGHTHHAGIKVVHVVPMQGEQNSLASIRVGKVDHNGNWPIEFSVTGLPQLTNDSYYILMLEQNGKPRYACGSFRVKNETTTVRFTVPYEITSSSRWAVTEMSPGIQFPGHVVMTTS